MNRLNRMGFAKIIPQKINMTPQSVIDECGMYEWIAIAVRCRQGVMNYKYSYTGFWNGYRGEVR